MNNKLREGLADKCKQFGLTDKALDELALLGSQGIEENASEEDISKKVDLLVPFAKAMQAEITRKAQNNKPKPQPRPTKDEGDIDSAGKQDEGNNAPAWLEAYMKPIKDNLSKLQKENEQLRKDKESGDRAAKISAKAKELGIPDFLMKRVSIAEDADFEAELTAMKQELVTNNLMGKEAAHEQGIKEDALIANAKAWAEALPNM